MSEERVYCECGKAIPPSVAARGLRWHANWCQKLVPPEVIAPTVQEILQRHGSPTAAASDYADRFGITKKAAERLFYRLRYGHSVQDRTWDRLETFARGS